MKTTSPVKKVLGSLRPYLPLLAAAVVSALISSSVTRSTASSVKDRCSLTT